MINPWVEIGERKGTHTTTRDLRVGCPHRRDAAEAAVFVANRRFPKQRAQETGVTRGVRGRHAATGA
jgi:hypothetical protein